MTKRKHILSIFFLFPLVGLKDDPLGMGWDLLETERSLVEGAGTDGNCIGAVPDFAGCGVGMSLCKQIDNTTSTSGVGPENFKQQISQSTPYMITGWYSNKTSWPLTNTEQIWDNKAAQIYSPWIWKMENIKLIFNVEADHSPRK